YYTTDRLVEGLAAAIEASSSRDVQWLRDRFWSPWSDDADGDENGASKVECRRRMPGVLVFRNDAVFGFNARSGDAGAGGRDEVLVLFLVGEEPTWGINKAALEEALDFIAVASKDGPAEVPIVGPTYSGSAASLRHELAAWVRERDGGAPCFSVLSGSA